MSEKYKKCIAEVGFSESDKNIVASEKSVANFLFTCSNLVPGARERPLLFHCSLKVQKNHFALLCFDYFTFLECVNGIEAKGRRHVAQADVATHNTLKKHLSICSVQSWPKCWENISYKTLNCVQKPPAMDPPIPESSPPAPPARPPRAPTRCYERTKKKRINNTFSQQGRQGDLKVACYQFQNCYFINWKNVNYQQDNRGHLQHLLIMRKLDCDHFKKCYSKLLTISKTTKGTYNMS